MALVSAKDLSPGMKVASDVMDGRGRLLIPHGVELTERHLRALQLWSVSAVEIHQPNDEAETKPESSDIPKEALEAAKAATIEAFRLNDSHAQTPLIQTLADLYLHRVARRLADEAKPPKRSAKSLEDSEAGKGTGARKGKTVEGASLEQLIDATTTLASLPAIYHEVVQVVNHPRSSATDLANVISGDTGLTARLLRVVNSAFYGFPGRIDTVTRAITIVGMNELCDLALATSVMGQFGGDLGGEVDAIGFWRHSLCCGVVARVLAKLRREPNGERYFVTGLLHDLGRLVMFVQMPQTSHHAVRLASEKRKALFAAERSLLGYGHTDVGNALLNAWNLPVSQQRAIDRHHRPLSEREYAAEAAVIHLADAITHAMDVGRSGESRVPPVSPEVWEGLKIPENNIVQFVADVDLQVADLTRIFELGN